MRVNSEQGLPPSPLPACPGTPNCVRESRWVAAAPDRTTAAVRDTLDRMRAVSVEPSPGGVQLHAVFRAGVFLDDLDVAVQPHADGTVVHVRSASRVGHWDLGVNGRRVRRFFRRLMQAV